jgi:hypothetical protein
METAQRERAEVIEVVPDGKRYRAVEAPAVLQRKQDPSNARSHHAHLVSLAGATAVYDLRDLVRIHGDPTPIVRSLLLSIRIEPLTCRTRMRGAPATKTFSVLLRIRCPPATSTFG